MSNKLKEQVNILFEATKDMMTFEEMEPHIEVFNNFISNQNYKKTSLASKLSSAGLNRVFNSVRPIEGKNAVSFDKYDKYGHVNGYILKHYVLTKCGLSKEDWNEVNDNYRATERLNNKGSYQIIPSIHLKTIEELLISEDVHELTVGLIAATGRRPHEILARATFTPVEGNDYKVIFDGQGKKKGEVINPFEIPTLFPADFIIKKLEKLRKEPDTKTLIEEYPDNEREQNLSIDRRRNKSLNRVVRTYFSDLPLREGEKFVNCTALRASYAALCVHRDFKNSSVGKKALEGAKVLGHITEENTSDRILTQIATTLGYLDYAVTEDVPFPDVPTSYNNENTHRVRINDSDYETFLELKKSLGIKSNQKMCKVLLDMAARTMELERQIKDMNYERKVEVSEYELMETEELNNHKSIEASYEKLNRAFFAITNHNDYTANGEKSLMILPNNVALRTITGCNGNTVKKWLEDNKTSVSDHANKYGLTPLQNRGKTQIIEGLKIK